MRNRWAMTGVLGTVALLAGTAAAAEPAPAPARVVSVTTGQGGSVSVPVPSTSALPAERPYSLTGNEAARPAVKTTWVRGWQGNAVEIVLR